MSSSFTISIQDIVNSRSVIGSNLIGRVENARSYIFDFDYPVPNEDFKKSLETNILIQYMRYEICVSPFPFWQLQLKSRLDLIMPYYIKMYNSAELEYDILKNLESTETSTSQHNSDIKHTDSSHSESSDSSQNSNTSSQDSSGNSENISSNFPQATISAGVDYATGATETTNSGHVGGSSSGTGSSSGNSDSSGNSEDIVNESSSNSVTRSGFSGSYAQAIKEYRQNLVRIEQMIIDEIADLFFWFPDL